MDIIKRNTDYALRLVITLAGNKDGLLSARLLAKRCRVSYTLACKLLQKLASADIAESRMGASGGFKLKKSADSITLHHVITAIQGQINVNRCLATGFNCRLKNLCPLRKKLSALQVQMEGYLKSTSLGRIIKKNPKMLK